uniref:Uncharacterized protein n=1 Tax=Panagrolaimus sp. PS1159 TaxID=55785 RepID=A0AC35F8M7_9BILA
MEVVDRDVRAKVKTMKKRFRTLIPAKKGPLNHEDFSHMAAMVDAFRNELQELSRVLNNALALASPQETTGPISSRPRVISTSPNISDSGNESSSEMSFRPIPSSPTMINEDFTAHLARLQASRASRRIKGEELRLSLEKSLIVQEEIKKRFAETKARRDSLGQ